MAERLNKSGVAVPSICKMVVYVPEIPVDGAPKEWPAVVTQVTDQDGLLIKLTAFPPGEPPRGIDAVIAYGDPSMPEANTWYWPKREI